MISYWFRRSWKWLRCAAIGHKMTGKEWGMNWPDGPVELFCDRCQVLLSTCAPEDAPLSVQNDLRSIDFKIKANPDMKSEAQ